MKRVSIRIQKAAVAVLGVAGAVGFGMTGCAPRLASVGTEGLLTRSFSNYSQSTVMRSEQLATADRSLSGSRTPVPRKETTRYGESSGWAGDRVERRRSQVIAPVGYATEDSGEARGGAGERVTGIPKVTDDRAAAGFWNMRFVTEEQVKPVRSVEAPAPPAQPQPQPQPQPVQQQRTVVASTSSRSAVSTAKQPVSSTSRSVSSTSKSTSKSTSDTGRKPVSSTASKPAAKPAAATAKPTPKKTAASTDKPVVKSAAKPGIWAWFTSKSAGKATSQVSKSATSTGTEPVAKPVVSTATTKAAAKPAAQSTVQPTSRVTYTTGRKTYADARVASTRVSAVVAAPTRQDQREADRQRKAESRRLVAERRAAETEARQAEQSARRAQAEQQKRERQLAMIAAAEARQVAAIKASNRAFTASVQAGEEAAAEVRSEEASSSVEPDGEAAAVVVESPTRVVSVAELQRKLQAAAGEGASVEDFLPGLSTLSQRASATTKPVPEFIETPAEEKTVVMPEAAGSAAAVAPPTHSFKPLETEHVKFSYYDPFGEGNNRFVVVLQEQRFCYPFRGRFLSGYGPRGRSIHTGVDIKGAKNDTVRAAFAGTVRMSKFYSGYGNCVVIRHKNGLETLYGHNTTNLVRVGDKVRAGDPIGLMGRTGRATTEHCHFEVRVQGQHINPALILDYHNMTLRSGVLAVTRQANGRILAMNRASGLAPSPGMDTEDAAAVSVASSSRSGSATKSAGGAGSSVYTVRSGDTLWGIARRFGTTIANLCALNNLDREATLPLGKKLKVK